MFNDLSTMQIIMLLMPVILLELGLKAFCIVSILKHGVQNLTKATWIAIIIVFSLIGPVSFLIFGHKKY
ncbi:PLDc N-terminal domain-containing protein [Serpentinicella sp. ANB-PHB4]|uniref:PLDc N-terminal domain-containing protein n=1 Tax=Serpentinicella sp. ANB-PHB4 TaxID=3074076 RepID=UPI0028623AC7|nr:PLDc N-terminal domain-containing protein [Serpentinicella sp. ANB-PHB4]MDR5659271.1 PLDc N-terminal domain-containing protein [Serpentinicella sp. ANB-PHB4]